MGNKSSRKTNKSDPTILTEDELNLLKTSTLYSEEEIQAWHTGFLKDCPTGQLDKKQFLHLYRVSYCSNRSINLGALVCRGSIPMANRISIVTSSSKPSIRTTTIGSILRNFCSLISTESDRIHARCL